MINILVISTNPMDGKMFKHFFENNINLQYCGQAFSEKQGLLMMHEKKADIIFVEIKPFDEVFNVDIVKSIKELDLSNYIICFSLYDEFDILQSVMNLGAYSYYLAPIDRNKIIRTVNTISDIIMHMTPPSRLFFSEYSMDTALLEIYNCSSTRLSSVFENIWIDLTKQNTDNLARIILTCQKFGTTLYYFLIDQETNDIEMNETLVLLFNHFMLSMTKQKTESAIKQLLYNYIKDCNFTVNKNQHDISIDRIIEAKKLICQYLNEEKPISLESIANEIFVSPSYLSRSFKKVEGMKFIDYLNFQRLDKAKILLLTTNNTIENIASICGYSEPNSFRRIFKQKIGMTPNAFRTSKKNESKDTFNTLDSISLDQTPVLNKNDFDHLP